MLYNVNLMQCKGKAKKQSAGYYTLRRFAAGKHPVHSCRATVGQIVPLDSGATVEEVTALENRLDEISRSGTRCKKRMGEHIFSEPSNQGSIATGKMCALRERIQHKASAGAAASASHRPAEDRLPFQTVPPGKSEQDSMRRPQNSPVVGPPIYAVSAAIERPSLAQSVQGNVQSSTTSRNV